MIRTLNIHYRDGTDLANLPAEILAHERDRILIQVFSGVLEEERIGVLLGQLDALFHGAAVLGTTTAGEIFEGQTFDNSIIISFSCFEHSTLRCAMVTQNDDLAEAGRQLGAELGQPDIKAMIAFGSGIKDKRTIFSASMLESLHAQIPQALIAGGQAGDNGRGTHTLVFTAKGITDRGVAAISIAGTDLVARNAYTLSWIPIGKMLTITHAQGERVFAIDGKTPYEIYSHYLGQEVADNLPLSAADFPLIIKRDGVQMAIHATGVNPDGSFDYIHHFHAGEQLQFGYCHADLFALGAQKLVAELNLSARPKRRSSTLVYRASGFLAPTFWLNSNPSGGLPLAQAISAMVNTSLGLSATPYS